jgi:hypothetical protein
LTAAGDANGGGTGKEFLINLKSSGTEPWNKWFHPSVSSSWVQGDFERPIKFHSYGVCSANDCPNRDPSNFKMHGRIAGSSEWIVLHTVESCPFTDRWQWVWYDVSKQAKDVLFDAFKLTISAVRSSGEGLQLGHLHIRSQVSGGSVNLYPACCLVAAHPAAIDIEDDASKELDSHTGKYLRWSSINFPLCR